MIIGELLTDFETNGGSSMVPRSVTLKPSSNSKIATKSTSVRYLDMQALSRTSTCCTLSTYSSASEFSYNEDDDEHDEAANAAAQAASFYTLRRNSSPEIHTCISESCATKGRSGTYILYLVPSGKRARALSVARDYLGSLLGFDESHLYPLHCTLTSFFTVTSQDINIGRDAIATNLAQSLLTFIEKEYCVKCTDAANEVESQELSDHTRIATSMEGSRRSKRNNPARKNNLRSDSSTTASPDRPTRRRVKTPTRLSHADDVQSPTHHGVKRSKKGQKADTECSPIRKCEMRKRLIRLRARYGGTTTTLAQRRFKRTRRSTASGVTSTGDFASAGAHVACSSCLFEIRHQPSREGVNAAESEKCLKHVFVTKDESVILPMQLTWRLSNNGKDRKVESASTDARTSTTPTHLKNLCKSLQDHLPPSCVVTLPHRNGATITAKGASHVALSSSKRRAKCSLSSVMAAARLYDSASDFDPDSDYWDLALCELESWGSLDDYGECSRMATPAKSPEGSRSLTPHVFREIVRITKVGVTVH